jgi:hypothetical protein
MDDTLSETGGCDLLARLFTKRGYALKRNVQFREYGVEFHIDGWDPKARVGFEFLTSEDDDHDDLTLEEYKTLTAAQRRGELALFIIDEVADAAHARLTAATRRGAAARKKAAAKRPASRSASRSASRAAARPLKAATKKASATKKHVVATKAAKPGPKKAAAKKPATKKVVAKPKRGRR